MKSEHRHDLKTNELSEWIAHLPQWLEKNRNNIIYFLVAIAVITAGWLWYSSRKSALTSQQTEFSEILSQLAQKKNEVLVSYFNGQSIPIGLANSADRLSTISQEINNKNTAALALIKRAETIRTELHYYTKSPDINQLTTQINKARDSYQKAVALLEEQAAEGSIEIPALTASAKYGLGLCEEELGNFDEAKKIYAELVNTDKLKNTPAGDQARIRLDIMGGYEEKITLESVPLIISTPKLVTPGSSPNDVVLQPSTETLVPAIPVEINLADINPVGIIDINQ